MKFSITNLWALLDGDMLGAAVDREIISTDAFDRLTAGRVQIEKTVNAVISSDVDVEAITVEVDLSDDDKAGVLNALSVMIEEAQNKTNALIEVAASLRT